MLAFLDNYWKNARTARAPEMRVWQRFGRLCTSSSTAYPRHSTRFGGGSTSQRKKCDARLILHLARDETQANFEGPLLLSRVGIRERALLYLVVNGGLRVSELVGLRRDDISFRDNYLELGIRGKGRKERVLTLWKSVADSLRKWLAMRGDMAVLEVFVNLQGEVITRSGAEYLLENYTRVAAQTCPSIQHKRVSPHVLRHTCAMHVLQAIRDIHKVALWLGHSSVQTTEIYLQADPSEKLETLETTVPPSLRKGSFTPQDKLIASASLRGR